MKRRELREHIFEILFRVEFMAEKDMEEQLELFFEEAHVRYAKRAFRKEEGRSDHAYLIDRVLDPQGKKLFSPAPAPRDADRARLHDAMRDKMRSGMPDQAKLKELFEKNT